MNHEVSFDSIESTREFVSLLAQVVLETKHDVEGDIGREMSLNFPRRLKALQIVEHKLRTLESHLEKVPRILNDLRSLRRLLFGQRTNGGAALRPTSIGLAKAETTSSGPSSEASRSGVPPDSAVARPASIRVAVRKRALSSYRDAHSHLEVADAVAWYIRPDFKTIDGRKSREANEAFMRQR